MTSLSQPRSSRLLEEAQRYLVGGVNSPVRTFGAIGQEPLFLVQGNGAVVRDVQGRRFIDLIMGWGALILGHVHPDVVRVVRQQIAKGTLLGLTHQAEVELAKAITEAFPAIEQIRFTASGTEACMTAIRLARAQTGRSKVLTFEGCYHGHSDGLLVKRGLGLPAAPKPGRSPRAAQAGLTTLGVARSEGIPEAIAQATLVAPCHDLQALEEVFQRFGDTIACAIVEPIAANMGVVVPEQAFLQRLRDLTRQHGSLLIFDEVVTGFRVTYGGAQTVFGITPDLTVLGKIIGGGFPVGAVGGPRHLMQRLAPAGGVYHAGTFAGHPFAMAAGLATLRKLQRRRAYERLETLGARLADGLVTAATRAKIPIQINRLGSMLTVFFSEFPVTTLTLAQQTHPTRFAQFARLLLRAGVLIPPSPCEAMFLSVAHTQEMIDHIITIASDVFSRLNRAAVHSPPRPTTHSRRGGQSIVHRRSNHFTVGRGLSTVDST